MVEGFFSLTFFAEQYFKLLAPVFGVFQLRKTMTPFTARATNKRTIGGPKRKVDLHNKMVLVRVKVEQMVVL